MSQKAKLKYAHLHYDYKQGGSEDEWKRAIETFGLVVIADHVAEGNSWYAYFIVNRTPTKSELRKMIYESYGRNKEALKNLKL